MKESDDIIDSTLDVVSTSMSTFDSTLGKIAIYQAGHNLGGVISGIIDKIVGVIPMDRE